MIGAIIGHLVLLGCECSHSGREATENKCLFSVLPCT